MAFKVGDAFVRLGMEIGEFSEGLEDAQKQFEQSASRFQDTGKTLTAAITAPFVGLATASLAAFGGFEKAMNKVSALGDITGDALEKLSNKAKELGAQTQYSARQAADAMGEFASQGFKADEIFEAIGGTLKLAAVEAMDLGDAAAITSGILRGFGLDVKNTVDVADLLAKTSMESSTSVQDLGYAFKYIGPVASSAGVGIEDISAALGVLGNNAIKGEQAGTALRKMFLDLANPSKIARDTLKEMQISITDANGKLLPFNQLVQNLAPLFNDMGKASKVFGDRVSDLMPIFRNGAKDLGVMQTNLKNFHDQADKSAKIINKGLLGSWEEFTSGLETAGIEIGKALAPAAEAIVKFATGIVNDFAKAATWFDKLPGPIKTFTLALAGMAAAVGPLLYTIGTLQAGIGSLKLLGPTLATMGKGFEVFGVTLNGLKGHLFEFASMVKGIDVKGFGNAIIGTFKDIGTSVTANIKSLPQTLSVAKTALLDFGSMAFKSIVDNSKAVGLALTSAGSSIASFASSVASAGIQGNLTKAGAAISSLGAISGAQLTAGLAAGRSAMLAFGASILPVTVASAGVLAAVTALAAAAYVIVQNWEDVKNVFVGFWTDIYNLVMTLGQKIYGVIETVFGPTIAGYVKKVWDGILSYYKFLWNTLVDIFQNGLKYIVQAGLAVSKALNLTETEKAFQGWLDKINGLKTAANEVGGATNKAVDATKGLTGAANEGSGAFKGFTSNIKAAKFGMSEMGDEADKSAGKLKEKIKTAVDGVRDILEDAAKDFPKFEIMFADKDSQGEIKKMEEKLRDINREWGVNMPESIKLVRNELKATIKQYQEWADQMEDQKFFKLFDKVVVADAEKNMDAFAKNLEEMFKKGEKDAEEFGRLMKKLGVDIGDATKFQMTGQNALSQAVSEARADIKKLEDMRAEYYRKLANAEADLLRTRRNGEIENVAASEKRVALAQAEVNEFDRLFNVVMPKAAENLNEAIVSEAVGGLDKIKEAAGRLKLDWGDILNVKGITSGISEVQKAADKALEDFKLLEKSGIVNAEGLRKAWQNYLEAKVAADREANKAMKIEATGLFKFIGQQSQNSLAEIQLGLMKAQDKFKEAFREGFGGALSNLFKGDFGGALDSIKGLANGFREAMDVALNPMREKFQQLFDNLSNQVSDFVTKKLFGMLMPAIDGIAKHIPFIGDAFNKTFGLAPGVDVAKAAVDAAKAAQAAGDAAAKTADALGKAAEAGAGAAKAASSAASSAGSIASAGGALSSASKGMAAATGGLLSTVSSVTGIVTGAISAVTGILSFLGQRHIEKDVGNIEVTTRGILNQLISIQETMNKYLPPLENASYLQRLDITLQQVVDQIVEPLTFIFDKLHDILKTLGGGIELDGVHENDGWMPPDAGGAGQGDNPDTPDGDAGGAGQATASRAMNTMTRSVIVLAKTLQSHQEVSEDLVKTLSNANFLPPPPPEGLSPDDLFDYLQKTNQDPLGRTWEWKQFLGGTGQFKEDLEYVDKMGRQSGNTMTQTANVIGEVTAAQLQVGMMTDDQLQNQIALLQKAGGIQYQLNQQIAELEARMSTARRQTSGPLVGGEMSFPPLSTVSGMPLTMNLTVNVNNADAQKVANQMTSTWRTRGIPV